MAEVQIIGWDDDYRWEEERRRVKECVRSIAEKNGFAFALVEYVLYAVGLEADRIQGLRLIWSTGI
jgi:hypothetical protein